MKKLFLGILVLVLGLVATGCSSDEEENVKPKNPEDEMVWLHIEFTPYNYVYTVSGDDGGSGYDATVETEWGTLYTGYNYREWNIKRKYIEVVKSLYEHPTNQVVSDVAPKNQKNVWFVAEFHPNGVNYYISDTDAGSDYDSELDTKLGTLYTGYNYREWDTKRKNIPELIQRYQAPQEVKQ